MTKGRFPYGQGSQTTPHLHDIGGRPVYGNVFFVDSGNSLAADTVNEGTKRKPFATLDYAVGQCTANNGDFIYVAPGHAETIISADQIDADVAGISIIGIGNGTNKPTLTYTVAAGEFVIGASNVWVENIRFVSSVTAVLKAIDIEDGVDYTTIRNCEFTVEAGTTDEFNATITLADNNIGTTIEGCLIDMELGGAERGIHMDNATGADIRTVIKNNRIQGDFSTGCIAGDTTLSNEILIQGNILQNGDGGGIGTVLAVVLLTGSTGIIADNYVMTNVASDDASITADACVFYNNVYSETVASGVGMATAAGTTLTA